jgi:hemerythrin
MEQIVWSDNYSVGVELFDEQHKRLIIMLNKMIKDPGATTSSETVSDVLTHMTSYAQEHFKSEEHLMIKHGYPHIEQHKSKHIAFKKKVTELCTATTYGIEAVPQVLLEYLQQWLTQHILNEDMEYKPFFEEKGIW